MSDPGRDTLAYHQASKHHLERYAPGPGFLDWANQPDPFRVYEGCPRVLMPLAGDRLDARYSEVRAGRLPPPRPLDRQHIGALFELALGLAACKAYEGSRWALRCNPSSGNLHPTEGYLITPTLPGLPAGVYHYLSRDHLLEQRAELPQDAVFSPVLGLTSIVWREAWKYGLRAFRYCQLDTGHAIGAFSFAAAVLGWHTRVLPWPGETVLATWLGVDRPADRGDAEPELPECLLMLEAGETLDLHTAADLAETLTLARWAGQANRLSAEHRLWPGLEEVAQATALPAYLAEAASGPAPSQPLRPPMRDHPLATLIRQRRSAQAFDKVTTLPAEVFFDIAARLLPADHVPPWTAWAWAPRVHIVFFVHRVAGMEPGLYLLLRDAQALPEFKAALCPDWLWVKTGPAPLPLYCLLAHDLRDVAATLSCHQAIAADSCFAVAMLADFEGIDAAAWRYRLRHWEAGLIGQVLYLEAEAAGLRGTGIGCFFDDAVHRLLGLASDGRWQVVYHFTVGGALEDTRLTTLPPYPEAFRERV